VSKIFPKNSNSNSFPPSYKLISILYFLNYTFCFEGVYQIWFIDSWAYDDLLLFSTNYE